MLLCNAMDNHLSLLASRSLSMSSRTSPVRTGPFTLRMRCRLSASFPEIRITFTCVIPPREPVLPSSCVTLAFTGYDYMAIIILLNYSYASINSKAREREHRAAAGASVGGVGGHQPRTDFPPFPPPRRLLGDGVEFGTVEDLPVCFGRLRKLYLLDLEPVCEELLAPARPGEGVGAGGVQLDGLSAAILQKLPLVVVQHDPRPLLPLPPRARLRCQRSDP